jgi:hypothetical protein
MVIRTKTIARIDEMREVLPRQELKYLLVFAFSLFKPTVVYEGKKKEAKFYIQTSGINI